MFGFEIIVLFAAAGIVSSNDNLCDPLSNEIITGTLIDTVNAGFLGDGAIYDAVNDIYWFGDRLNAAIVAMDANTRQFIDEYTIQSFDIGNSHALVLTNDQILYVTSQASNKISGFDISDLNNIQQISSYDTGLNDNGNQIVPNGLCFDNNQKLLCFSDAGLTAEFGSTFAEGIYCMDLNEDSNNFESIFTVLSSGNGIYPNGCDFIRINDADGGSSTILYNFGMGGNTDGQNFFQPGLLIQCDLTDFISNTQGSSSTDYTEAAGCVLNEEWNNYRDSINDVRTNFGNVVTSPQPSLQESDGILYLASFLIDLTDPTFNSNFGVIIAAYLNENGIDFCGFDIISEDTITPGAIAYDSKRDILVIPEIDLTLVTPIKFIQINRNTIEPTEEPTPQPTPYPVNF